MGLFVKNFDQQGTFEALRAVQKWLEENGYQLEATGAFMSNAEIQKLVWAGRRVQTYEGERLTAASFATTEAEA